MLNAAARHCWWITFGPGLLLALTASGCALGTTPLEISHNTLDEVGNRRAGSILVKRFVDSRDPEKKPYIGNKRNGYGMVLGHFSLIKGVALEDLLSSHFADALREAGYNAVVEAPGSETNEAPSAYDAVLTGDIRAFWMDLYMAVWHKVEVRTTLMSSDLQEKLWESDMKGTKKNMLWIGARGEFTKVIGQALTAALNQAVAEFASDEFYQSFATKRD